MSKFKVIAATGGTRWTLKDAEMTTGFFSVARSVARNLFRDLVKTGTVTNIVTSQGSKNPKTGRRRSVSYSPSSGVLTVGCQSFNALQLLSIQEWAMGGLAAKSTKKKSRKK